MNIRYLFHRNLVRLPFGSNISLCFSGASLCEIHPAPVHQHTNLSKCGLPRTDLHSQPDNTVPDRILYYFLSSYGRFVFHFCRLGSCFGQRNQAGIEGCVLHSASLRSTYLSNSIFRKAASGAETSIPAMPPTAPPAIIAAKTRSG